MISDFRGKFPVLVGLVLGLGWDCFSPLATDCVQRDERPEDAAHGHGRTLRLRQKIERIIS